MKPLQNISDALFPITIRVISGSTQRELACKTIDKSMKQLTFDEFDIPTFKGSEHAPVKLKVEFATGGSGWIRLASN